MNEMIDTKFFSIKKLSEGNGPVVVDGMVVDFFSGEEVYENRIYRHETNPMSMMMLTKVKNDKIFFHIAVIDDQRVNLLQEDLGWFNLSIYNELVKKLEEVVLQNCFCMDKIVPGRLYNVYFQMQNCKDN